MNKQTHQPVLLAESLESLNLIDNGIYIDGTFGRGGHSKEIYAKCHPKLLVALDKDTEAANSAREHFNNKKNFVIEHISYANIRDVAKQYDIFGTVNGILLDLGLSSPQLDQQSRGFSFMQNGPLDMRMDLTQKATAADWISQASETEIANVLWQYGEERCSRQIAKAIVTARINKPITTTENLVEIINSACPKYEKNKHPATRTFQAIRIVINNELVELEQCLEQCLDVLAIGGRLVVISFHSLEDRIVKRFIRRYSQSSVHLPEHGIVLEKKARLRKINKVMIPSNQEITINSRARSAKMRVAEKVS